MEEEYEPDYKAMYIALFNATQKAIEVLKQGHEISFMEETDETDETDYKALYLALFNDTLTAIEILQQGHIDCEDIFMGPDEEEEE